MDLTNQTKPHCFTAFKTSIAHCDIPTRFTFPFCYQPNELSLIATQELQTFLSTDLKWSTGDRGLGRMFGVLVVKNKNNDIGYLSAISGKTTNEMTLNNFVPPVFDMDITTQDKSYTGEQAVINQINTDIKRLEGNPDLLKFKQDLDNKTKKYEQDIELKKRQMTQDKKSRKALRLTQKETLSADDFREFSQALDKNSVEHKLQLRDLKNSCQASIDDTQQKLNTLTSEINQLKERRKNKSSALQKLIFQQFKFLNSKGEIKNLIDIFGPTPRGVPPSGAGGCAAPKLLQYAFQWDLQPIAMAEFWWGEAPKSEIRQHGNFYGACLGKCEPILAHMLEGMVLDDNPLLDNPAEGKELVIIYQDKDLLVINKPAEFLSVPGKNIQDSVYTRMKSLFPNNESPFIVHRLDQSTSGLMVIALNKKVHKKLQKQFIERSVKKSYVALIEGDLKQDQGVINLPLRGDLNDRPRQLICQVNGKPSETSWKVLERIETTGQVRTKVQLFPITGRTHQLRVHCAHSLGLNMPIVGDDLYGKVENRLHLHANTLEFMHPNTKENMTFEIESEF
ncbi:RluA family pseudouridine synthase [Marinicellulosiphila megalodicopiae]|uniref:RluA family pseudouridine synthase n=1 Tax=Marinicellulosiphila megalodicopiae TaxID=2724896 RepID=UPI003BB12960